jgi:preprotein translocase subunit SecA
MISLLYAGDQDVLRDATTSSAVFWDRARKARTEWATAGGLAALLAVVIVLLVLGPEGTGLSFARRDSMAIVASFLGLGLLVYIGWLVYKFMPGRSDRVVIGLRNWVRANIDPLEEKVRALSDDDLRGKRREFEQRLKSGETIDAVRAEAYACVREASRRAQDHRQFECQLIGARVIERNNVAEMRTGEGKTIVCYAANYMKVLQGLKVHMVTVNDYLVKRDAEFCKPIFELLGISVGYISSDIEPWGEGAAKRQVEYACDITYGTNSEFGFDYLRDNMKNDAREQMQGRQDFAVVDEVDSILIDEARTPLIISGAARDDVSKYKVADTIARNLIRKHEQAVREFAGRIDEIEANPPAGVKAEPKFKSGIKKFRADPLWLSSDEAEMIGFTQYFVVEMDRKSAHMTEHGAKAAQAELGQGSFYESRNMNWPHYIDNAIRAHICYTTDKEYVVQDDTVIIVDEFTGRMMHGRQWSDGLHQAVEAKERVTVKQETQTLATITLQNLFKLYKQLAGMTGTAMTEADEFNKIYKLEVIAIPTNKPVRRIDYNDKLFKSINSKFDAIVEEIHSYSSKGYPGDPWSLYDMLREARKFLRARKDDDASARGSESDKLVLEALADADTKLVKVEEALDLFNDGEGDPSKLEEAYLALAGDRIGGRPLLVGTVAVETSEKLSQMLTRTHGVDHEVLNAKNHAREAEIVAKAGHQHTSQRGKHKGIVGNVTIATNMAGRGTDIKLGQNVAFLGGLHVVGTERHESRRIDNQLRGRCGRQGDPGSSRFFLSFEDDLIKLFMGEWMLAMLNKFALEEGVPIEHKSLTRGIANAQKKVEERNFGIRKNLLEYDEVPDQQRKTFYEMRQRVLEGRDLSGFIWEMIDQTVADACHRYYDEQFPAICAAEWSAQHLSVPIDANKLDTTEVALLKSQVHDLATSEARSSIQRSFGEYIDPGAPQDEWDVRGLIQWSSNQFGVTLTQRQVTETDPDELCDRLIEAAIRKIETVDLSPLEEFCDRNYGRLRLARWAHDKFGVNIPPQDLRSASPEEADKIIVDKMRDAYRKREAEYPVGAVIEYAIARNGTNVNAIYEQIAKWANLKFRQGWTYEHFAGMNPQQIFNELRGLNEDYLRNGKLDHEIESAVSQHSGDQLQDWARQRFGAVMETSPLDPAGDVREQLRRCGYEMLRYELTQLERMVVLQTLDQVWKDHMYAMDLLRSGIGLRGYAERDPKIEFKREGTRLFNELMSNIRERVTDLIFKVQVSPAAGAAPGPGPAGAPAPLPAPRSAPAMQAVKQDASNLGVSTAAREAQQKQQAKPSGAAADAPAAPQAPVRRDAPKVGRNDPCPCGSGKKYKQCHGRGA